LYAWLFVLIDRIIRSFFIFFSESNFYGRSNVNRRNAVNEAFLFFFFFFFSFSFDSLVRTNKYFNNHSKATSIFSLSCYCLWLPTMSTGALKITDHTPCLCSIREVFKWINKRDAYERMTYTRKSSQKPCRTICSYKY
jgi:hypothetical protein